MEEAKLQHLASSLLEELYLNSYILVKFSLILEKLSTGIKTHRFLSVFVFNSLGFVTILSSRESLRTICCTELKLPSMLVMML